MTRFGRQLFGVGEIKLDLTGSEVITGSQGGILLMGSSSTGAQFLTINSEGQLVTTAAASSGSTTVTGSVFIENFPAVQEITGTVALEGGEITVGNFPATQVITGTVGITSIASPVDVQGTFWQAEQPVSVSNFPAVQTVTGTVGITSIASPVSVEGTFFQATQPITGVVEINNFPATQTVAGTVAVSNLTVTQSILFEPAPSATVTGVTASVVSTEILAENANRKLAHFYLSASSDETSLATWVLFGTGTASPTNFSFMMFPHDSYELPERALTMPVQAVFTAHTGSALLQISEVE